MTMVLRVIIGLWGLFFSFMALQGIFDPQTFTETFGVTGTGKGANALRADLGGFFLVAGGGALWGAIRPHQAKVLWVPAALFGVAFIARIIGIFSGDPYSQDISVALTIEAVSVILMLFAARHFMQNSRG